MKFAGVILSTVPCTALQYFSTLSNEQHDFGEGEKVAEHKMCVLIFSIIFV
jgi:hypothetical protein